MNKKTVFFSTLAIVLGFGLMLGPALAADITVLKTQTIDDIVAGPVEKFVQGGKFLEGPIMDKQGNLWVVSIEPVGFQRSHPMASGPMSSIPGANPRAWSGAETASFTAPTASGASLSGIRRPARSRITCVTFKTKTSMDQTT